MKRANRYRVSGNDKAQGALGHPSVFEIEVSAPDVQEAHNAARAARYAAGREHVHITRTELMD